MSDLLTVASFVVGLGLVAVGAGMAWLPAGVVVAGLVLVGCAVLFERSERSDG
jgi:hypothetical protein